MHSRILALLHSCISVPFCSLDGREVVNRLLVILQLVAAKLPDILQQRLHKQWTYAAGASAEHAGSSGSAGTYVSIRSASRLRCDRL